MNLEPLREAAWLMRERANAATDGPWWSDDSDQSWQLHGVAFRLPPPWEGAPEQIVNKQILKAPKASEQVEPYWPDAADAAHMVPMLNPAVALAIADWLDTGVNPYACVDRAPMFRVAAAYLGTQP
ncbi:hypothetical protein [Micromonospora sp. RV43]|uniref:hypothetical protein n=1 Tax=Micromonospora sp. RV43 TaxID=1661387 RepID=UPI000ABFE1FF|nr:hypothetical protein [Micromonospora sp. RV43]